MTVNKKRFIAMVTNKPLGKDASTEAGAPSEMGECRQDAPHHLPGRTSPKGSVGALLP